MTEVDKALRYLFVLSLVLILVAYWAGSNKVLGTLFSGIGGLGNVFTGRNAQGNFASYPTNAPTT